MDILAEVQNVVPAAAEAVVGRHGVVRFTRTTPAHRFEAVLAEVGGRLIELTARDSYDERLAEFLLDRAAEIDLPGPRARSIRVAPAEYPAPWAFTAVVIVPPAIAQRFEHESAALSRVTYWVVPAFDGEFADGAAGDVFWHQLQRKDGWRSDVIRWDRARKTSPVFD